MNELISDERAISVKQLSERSHSRPLESLQECMDRELLVSPDTHKPLELDENRQALNDGSAPYPIRKGSPVLYPCKIIDNLDDDQFPLKYYSDAILQYFLLGQIKSAGEVNAPAASSPYEKHLYRMHDFCRSLSGLTLDVGCDIPGVSKLIFPEDCEYIGLDPSMDGDEFRIIGIGEVLPFSDGSIDNVIFNTSLDHILDYRTAIEEAFRVLKPGGMIVIATYVWMERATLLTDNVHFHHFKEYEISGALKEKFNVVKVSRYECPKGDLHRYGLYMCGEKVNR